MAHCFHIVYRKWEHRPEDTVDATRPTPVDNHLTRGDMPVKLRHLASLGCTGGTPQKGDNILDSQGRIGHPFQELKKRKPPVSIIIGIICEDAIVVASDSQLSWGTAKRTDSQKIFPASFNDATGLIGNSGSVAASQRVVEITKSYCFGKDLSDYRQLAENAQKASEVIRGELMSPFKAFITKLEDFQKLFDENNYSLVMANYFDKQPYLFTLDFPPGISTRQKNYTAIGCGANLATFLLGWFDFANMNRVQTVITAAFIIGEVKKADAFCGGTTQVAYLKLEDNAALVFPPEIMRVMECEIESGVTQYKNEWRNAILEILPAISKKLNVK
jgi:20S proteasome alpha/beta subunit